VNAGIEEVVGFLVGKPLSINNVLTVHNDAVGGVLLLKGGQLFQDGVQAYVADNIADEQDVEWSHTMPKLRKGARLGWSL